MIIPDVSSYEPNTNFAVMKAAGAAGCYVRAGQGFLIDSELRVSQVALPAANLSDGYYHFFDPRYDPTQQAEKFWSWVKDQPGKLPLVPDYEAPDSWGGNYTGWKNLYNFLERLKQLCGGRKIDIYTGYYYWLDHSPNPITQASSLAYFKQYGLWLAWYADPSIVKIPAPWTQDDLDFLQFTANGDGKKYGSETLGIDLNWFNGDVVKYQTQFDLTGETDSGGEIPPPPTNDPVIHIIEVDLSKNKLCFTPSSTNVLLYQTPEEQCQLFGWDGAMNFGAGFSDNPDGKGGTVFGSSAADGKQYSFDGSFESIFIDPQNNITNKINGSLWIAAPYARPLLINGEVNSELVDNPNVGPWSALAKKGMMVSLVTVEGQEGAAGCWTQTQFAEWGKAQGFEQMWLGDSGKSCKIWNKSGLDYAAYPDGMVQCVGYKSINNGGSTMDYAFSISPDTANGNTIRSDHNVPMVDNKIGALAFGKKAYGNEIWGDGTVERWLHILAYEDYSGNLLSLGGWIAEIHGGKKVATIVEISLPSSNPVVQVNADELNIAFSASTLTATFKYTATVNSVAQPQQVVTKTFTAQ